MAEPSVKYATTSDGVGIAFADTGGDGVPVVYMRGSPFTHVQLEWRETSFNFWFDHMFARRRLITFDCRGCGLSDRDVGEVSVEAFGRDIAAVADKLGLDSLALFAGQADGMAAISFAADNPERVSRLILRDTYADGARFFEIPQVKAFLSMMENDWDMFTTTLAHYVVGWGTLAATEYVEFLRAVCTQEQALAFFQDYVMSADTSDDLPRITQPTLVLSHKNVAIPDFDTVRNLAARLPNAELVVLEGTWGQPGDNSPVMEAALDRLLGDAPTAIETEPAVPAIGSLVTILFTDIEGSTALTQELGDAGARELFREHERITREALAAHGGSEVKTMGDGFMISFGSAVGALDCAIAIQRALAEGEVKVRIGLNAGEPIAEEEPDGRGDLFGTSVILAARIAAQAKGGEILASNVVRELVAGRGFLFSDQGERVLRGFEDPVRVYEVSWQG
ncbi:MAG: adenylate/guanylate cyclase domain-containing protein [Chloroflexi bacterium]|nr:adenylate/guanylate cyclase domain-containing protein [Chloroflexota bacterium]MCI0817416.1 adenylate/guanylate cyclase domain-containing protein [Chloroflexota bacterium]MCI0819372.1 adenylate/guanylate cyclase domain-containing protein [Chloroflexota bacterium]MCI0838730.1 adenylate/guanylate cyclase domain-containing protein [Chloroflexota bacterium]MCI0842393.1 adenylate/guanylate cyclase domain-containing protein [Chloroflexota bacterium]